MHAALKPLIDAHWLDEEPTSPEEIRDLFGLVERRPDEGQGALKYPDSIFTLAYGAVLSAATVLLRAHGVRARRERHHERTFATLRQMAIPGLSERANYYDDCRRKRNTLEYDSAGDVSDTEARELVDEATRFVTAVREWMRHTHSDLLHR